MFQQQPDFANTPQPILDGGVSQNSYLPAQQPFAGGMPNNNPFGGAGDPSAALGALGGMGGMDGSMAGFDNLSKAIGAAAQMGLIPGAGGQSGGGMGLGLPRFGSQSGANSGQRTSGPPRSNGSMLNAIPGVGVATTLGRSVNSSVNRAIPRAVNRAVNQSINRAFRF